MRKTAVILLLLIILSAVNACGRVGRAMDGGSPALVGTWDWLDTPYYIFNEDGTGSMTGLPIRWGAREGVLAVCTTPVICRERCAAPTLWNYSISGQVMTLSSQLSERLGFEYTRR